LSGCQPDAGAVEDPDTADAGADRKSSSETALAAFIEDMDIS